ncbi:putative transposase [Branchiibius hedensis]|uniref:Putative transposase n=1 Tax=Branchiibius hedensis TaxID=672460 RepID=A0A2Y8ZRF4_9MICO|nr:RNA-guided endonuclease TnpB family protein [Branchiibius hedensis]PWJ25651.1 putative transposase [Branchiibius hedensis]SSA34464.1 putative transposase [Branchiibius hedensis]
MKVRYTYRLRPGAQARAYLGREWDACRFVWNQLVEASQTRFRQARATGDLAATFGYKDQAALVTQLRHNVSGPGVDAEGANWLALSAQDPQQQTCRAFAKSRTKALLDRKNKVRVTRRAGLPRFKSRHHSLATLSYAGHNFGLTTHPATGRDALRLPGGVLIPVVWLRPLPGKPSSVTVFQDAVGHWYASFVVQAPDETLPAVGDGRVVGIDWGIKQLATTVTAHVDDAGVVTQVDESGTFDLLYPGHGKTAAQKLARYQRMMARRSYQAHGNPRGTPPTKGYRRAKKLTAKAHQKIANQRSDTAHKWAKALVAQHDRVAVEDFRPKFMSKNRSLARKAADAACGATKAAMVWQAAKAGRDLKLVNPAFTTMDCFHCGARAKHRIPLDQRTYTCTSCGVASDRDKNAAAVVVARAFGRGSTTHGSPVDKAAGAGQRPAGIEGVRPEPAAARAPAA